MATSLFRNEWLSVRIRWGTLHAAVHQLEDGLLGKEDVVGSSPTGSFQIFLHSQNLADIMRHETEPNRIKLAIDLTVLVLSLFLMFGVGRLSNWGPNVSDIPLWGWISMGPVAGWIWLCNERCKIDWQGFP